MDNTLDARTFSAMQDKKPYASYRKTTLGKIYVMVLNPYTEQSYEGLLLYGKDNFSDTAIVSTWSANQDAYFTKKNKRHLDTGKIIRLTEKEAEVQAKEVELPIEQYSDEQLTDFVNKHYMTFTKKLSTIDTETVLYRLLEIAKKEDKSEKYSEIIKKRLSEIQSGIPVDEI